MMFLKLTHLNNDNKKHWFDHRSVIILTAAICYTCSVTLCFICENTDELDDLTDLLDKYTKLFLYNNGHYLAASVHLRYQSCVG